MLESSSNKGAFFKRAALIGTGLIGGSIGLALRERRLVETIVGYDRDTGSLEKAINRGAVDIPAGSAVEAARKSDLIILAVPVLGTLKMLEEILPILDEGTLITDVGSTKGSIMAAVEQQLPEGVFFIGGHPMAGSEETGIDGADAALIENAIYVLTPGSRTPEEMVCKLSAMLTQAGAQTLTLDPLEHDRVVAAVSHLPHIVAAALVQSVAGVGGDMELMRTLAAGGFRDSTRIALGNPEVWKDICISNRWALLGALKKFKANIDLIEKELSEPNPVAIEEYLHQARDYRDSVPHRGRGILPEIYEVIVLVRDTPGVIGKLTTLLGKAGVNIDAIEILHVRELVGGSIRLGFRDRENKDKALHLLQKEGYNAHAS